MVNGITRFSLSVVWMFFTFFLPSFAIGQVNEGKVIYAVSYPDSRLDSNSVLPTESVTFFKDHKIRIDLQSGRGIENRVIVDNRKEVIHVLTDMMGDRTAVMMTKKDVEEETKSQKLPEFTVTDESKTIAGYRCIKANATLADGRKFTIWFTKEIKIENANWNNQFRDVDGFLMEFTTQQGAINMQMTAKNVSIEKIDDTVFNIPESYRIVTKNELNRMSKGK